MKKVTIKRPSKTNMQSGLKKTKMWIIEFEFDPSLQKDVLMGWNSSKNTTKQLKLNFDSLDDAILWCQKNSYQYRVIDQTYKPCLLYTSPSPRDLSTSRMPSSA